LEDDLDLREALAEYKLSRPDPPARMTFEEFLEWCDEDTWAEWVDGEVELLTPASSRHQKIKRFLVGLMDRCAGPHQCGEVFDAPFLVRLPEHLRRAREPDILFVRREHFFRIKENFFDGSPDLIVEIVSPDSRTRDYKVKYKEYEAARVDEYWVIDPGRRQAGFFRLGPDGRFHPVQPDDQGVFRSEAFPGFWLTTAWLWRDTLPSVDDVYIQEADGYGCVYEKGKREGKREDIRELLAVRFGQQSAEIQRMVNDLNDLDALNDVLRRLYSVNSIEDARNAIHDGLREQPLLNKD
jgi:Uma2 family endonuclease